MVRVPESKRLRSVSISNAGEPVANGVTFNGELCSHVFDDDVKVVGIQLLGEWMVNDAASNSDGMVNSSIVATRTSLTQTTGYLVMLTQLCTWNAVITIGGETRKSETIMFPDDTGWELDEGEAILVGGMLEYDGGVASITYYVNCNIFYVER